MSSEVDIANRALSMLGEIRITSMADANKGARAMSARFDMLRDAELSAYPWRFSVTRTNLAASTDVPEWGYSTIYDRPVDDLRPIRIGGAAVGVYYSASGVHGQDAPYEIIGGRIHTSMSAPLNYEYIARIADTGQFDPLFVEALAARLAVDAAEELTQSNSKKEAAMMIYRDTLSEARRVNSLYRPPRRRSAGTWVQSRVNFSPW